MTLHRGEVVKILQRDNGDGWARGLLVTSGSSPSRPTKGWCVGVQLVSRVQNFSPTCRRFPKSCIKEVRSEHSQARLYKAQFQNPNAQVTQNYK